MEEIDDVWIEQLPKVELHVHLEGSILPDTLMYLANKNGLDILPRSVEELYQWYTFTDFPHFADVYQTFSKVIVSSDDIYQMTLDFLKEQARQNIRHTEATYTAITHYRNNGIPFPEQFAAVRAAASKAQRDFGVSLGLIVDIPRELATPEEALMTARWVADAHGDGLVLALGLGGYEPGFPPEAFSAAFDLAREARVPAVVHAGETGPASNVSGSIETLGAVRIGHGVAAIGDPYTLDLIKERGITMEVCVSSNVCLKVVENIHEHPFKRMDECGLEITINTDDPPIFNTDLNREYRTVARAFQYSKDSMKRFALQSVRASLMPEDAKKRLSAEIYSYQP